MAPMANYEPVYLPDGQDFLMGPIMAGLIPFMALYDGSLDLCDFALANEALAVRSENEYRAQKAAEAEAKRRQGIQ